jgi:pimeloyl-ACP methyl ester carboxylesterase
MEPIFTETGDKPTLITVPYDWRKSITVGSEALAAAIERAATLHGGKAKIYLAAHSMGGLVARYYLQCDDHNKKPGFDQIVSLLTFGTPHKGAVVALAAALGLHTADFMSAEQSRSLANNHEFQGLYNLFPQAGSRPVWAWGGAGGLLAQDVFDRDIAKALNLNEKSLVDTEAIFRILARPWRPIRTFLFVGSRFETITHVLWNGVEPVVVRTRDGGDGTVNLQGAIPENQQIRFTDFNHTSLIKSDEARAALRDIFNAYAVLLAAETTVSLTVASHFIESEQPIEIKVSVDGPGVEVHGKLYLERARLSPQVGEELFESDFDGTAHEFSRDLSYNGPDLLSMNVKFEGVTGPAAFRPVFETTDVPPRRFVGLPFLIKSPP